MRQPAQYPYQNRQPLESAQVNSLFDELYAVLTAGGQTPKAHNAAQDNGQLLAALRALSGMPYYASGSALPTSDKGPIWHADYQSVMVWTTFSANGASYTGYASVLVGTLLADTQPTPRIGYVKSGVTNLSRSTYAALRGWAMHNGVMVALGTWAAGAIAVADNADGTTFRVFDVRGEFPRYWDDGRGVNSGRVFGAWETGSDLNGQLYGNNTAGAGNAWCSDQDVSSTGWEQVGTATMTSVVWFRLAAASNNSSATAVTRTTGKARPRNTALLAAIHI